MRVALVTHYFSTHGGGVELVAERLARELVQRHGIDITWYASDCDPVPAALPRALGAVAMRSCNAVERATGLPYPFWSPGALRRLAAGIRAADRVHVHDFAYTSSLAAARLARRAGVPLLLTQHTGAVRPGNRLAGLAHGAIESLFAGRCFESARALAFVSESSRTYFERRLATPLRAVTLWNGVDAAPLPTAAGQTVLRAKVLGEDPRPCVLFVGRLVRKKGVEIVRRAAAALPQVRFVLAGRGAVDPALWGLDNVSAPGHLDAARLRELYLAADLLMLPSYSEGFPLVVQEALVNGLAVLSTDEVATACPPAAALLHTCPLPRRDDAAPWIEALRKLLAGRDAHAVRAARAASAAALWSWPRCADAYARLLADADADAGAGVGAGAPIALPEAAR